ncbi:hypothetical protein MMC09_003314 [Bachmanniomyces sp. S44760]|nr:hypothetical protein [Bachmanniomyces sp. S44760]
MGTPTVSAQFSLLELLSNHLILYQTCPYLPVYSLLALGAVSQQFQDLIYGTPNVFRYLDLSTIKGAVSFDPIDVGGNAWRNQRMDEAVTEEDFYSGPLRGIFASLKRKGVLKDVQTLILDGLSVPADLLREIICEDSFNVRVLSIRMVKNLNEGRLQQILKYACRPTRAEGSPNVKAIYFFGPRDGRSVKIMSKVAHLSVGSEGVTSTIGAQLGASWNHRSHEALNSALEFDGSQWYTASGPLLPDKRILDWSATLEACRGIIAFDVVLCRGPDHNMEHVVERSERKNISSYLGPQIATTAIGPGGCQICHGMPEGGADPRSSPLDQLPLIAPPPRHSSALRAAQQPAVDALGDQPPLLYARCVACLFDRYCESCHKFWCENCYEGEAESTARYTEMQKLEMLQNQVSELEVTKTATRGRKVLIHLGLCTESCLVAEMYHGAGSGGMWA